MEDDHICFPWDNSLRLELKGIKGMFSCDRQRESFNIQDYWNWGWVYIPVDLNTSNRISIEHRTQQVRKMMSFLLTALVVNCIVGMGVCQSAYQPLFSYGNLTSTEYQFKCGTLDKTGTLLFVTARSISNLSSYILTYSFVTGEPILLSSHHDPNNNQPIQYDNIDLAGDYLMVNNTLQQILVFNSTDGSYIGLSSITSFAYGAYLSIRNLYVYSTSGNAALNVTPAIYYLNLTLSNIISSAPHLIDADPGENAYMTFSQKQTMMAYVSGSTTILTILSTSNWALVNRFNVGFTSTGIAWGYGDTTFLLTGASYSQIYYNGNIYFISLFSSWYYPGVMFSQAGNYFYWLNPSSVGYCQMSTYSFPCPGKYLLTLNFFPRNMKGGNNYNFIFFSNYQWGQLVVYRASSVPQTCIPPYYMNYTYDLCMKCMPNCVSCTTYDSCLSCETGSIMYGGGAACCLSQTQYYNSIDQTCMDCGVNCLTCSGTDCLICEEGYQIYGGHCCKDGQYWNDALQVCSDSAQCVETFSNGQRIYTCDQIDFVSNLGISLQEGLIRIPFAAQIFTFMSPFIFFSNDCWLYIYHNRNYSQLIITSTFLKILSDINRKRMVISFLDTPTLRTYTNLSQYFTSNYINYTFHKVLLIDEEQTYFTLNIEDLFIFSWSVLLVAFMGFHILRIILENTLKKPNIIYKFVRKMCNFNFLIRGMLQTNSIVIVFYSVRQIASPFYLNPMDKFNIILTLGFLFILLLYSFCFYILLFQSYPASISQVLNCSKRSKFNYCYQPARQMIRCMVIGSIHSFFLPSYTWQISILIIARLLTVVIIIWNSHAFKWKITFCLMVVYSVFLLFFDIFLLVSYFVLQTDQGKFITVIAQYHSFMEIVLVFGIVGSAVLTILALIVISIYNIIIKLRKRNAVKNNIKRKGKGMYHFEDTLIVLKNEGGWDDKSDMLKRNTSKIETDETSVKPKRRGLFAAFACQQHATFFKSNENSEYQVKIRSKKHKHQRRKR